MILKFDIGFIELRCRSKSSISANFDIGDTSILEFARCMARYQRNIDIPLSSWLRYWFVPKSKKLRYRVLYVSPMSKLHFKNSRQKYWPTIGSSRIINVLIAKTHLVNRKRKGQTKNHFTTANADSFSVKGEKQGVDDPVRKRWGVWGEIYVLI